MRTRDPETRVKRVIMILRAHPPNMIVIMLSMTDPPHLQISHTYPRVSQDNAKLCDTEHTYKK